MRRVLPVSRQAVAYAATLRRWHAAAAILASALLHLLAAGTTLAQASRPAPPPLTTLTTPLAEHPEPLTQPGALLELRDGRVLISDVKEHVLTLLDFAAGTGTTVSRQGAGPLEYRFPAMLFDGGDTLLVVDMMLQRILVLDAAAKPLRSRRLVEGGDAIGAILKLGTVIALDRSGRLYSETRGIRIVDGKMPTASDTVALVRWAVPGVRGDTLATRIEHTEMPKMGGDATRGFAFKLPVRTFDAHDAWAVFPDGAVAVARWRDYHTEWTTAAGKHRVGRPVPFTPAPITERDKAWARKVTREAADEGMKLGGAMAAGTGQKMPKMTLEVEDPPSWPATRPPFSGVRAAPDGRLWVARTIPADGVTMEYDVIAPGGGLAQRVRLPRDVTLLGFGKGVLYAVRKDADDLRYVQRYRLP